jgi:hypothetical protein
MSAATSDAVGVSEALVNRREDNVLVGIDEWEDTADLVASRNVLIVGSGATNMYALVLNDLFAPLHFIIAEGRAMDCIMAGSGKTAVFFGPHTGDGVRKGQELTDSAGLLIAAKNVFEPDTTLVWAAGINGMGTQAVAGLLRDLLRGRVSLPESVVGCVVVPAIRRRDQGGLKEYYRRLRISDYDIVYAVDASGGRVHLPESRSYR